MCNRAHTNISCAFRHAKFVRSQNRRVVLEMSFSICATGTLYIWAKCWSWRMGYVTKCNAYMFLFENVVMYT